ncbi:MAG: hypothetical protein V1647_02750 [Pseudomonadota bacterium]
MSNPSCVKHIVKKDSSWCPDCGANLTLSEKEIESRDFMFSFFAEHFEKQRQKPEFAEKCKDLKFDRNFFDGWLSRNAATFSLLVGTTIFGMDDKKAGERKTEPDGDLEDRVKELERRFEKLKDV